MFLNQAEYRTFYRLTDSLAEIGLESLVPLLEERDRETQLRKKASGIVEQTLKDDPGFIGAALPKEALDLYSEANLIEKNRQVSEPAHFLAIFEEIWAKDISLSEEQREQLDALFVTHERQNPAPQVAAN